MSRFTAKGIKYQGRNIHSAILGISIEVSMDGRFIHSAIVSSTDWKEARQVEFGRLIYHGKGHFQGIYTWNIPITIARKLGEDSYIDDDVWNDFIISYMSKHEEFGTEKLMYHLWRVFDWKPHALFEDVY